MIEPSSQAARRAATNNLDHRLTSSDRTNETHFDRSNNRCFARNTFVIIEAVDVSLPALLRLKPQFALRTGHPATAELVLISRRRVASSPAICKDARYGGDRHKHRHGPLMQADLQDIAPSASADSCAGTCDLITSLTPHKRAQLKMTYQGRHRTRTQKLGQEIPIFRRPRRGEFRPSLSDDRRAGHSRPCLAIRFAGATSLECAATRDWSFMAVCALTRAEFQSISFRLHAPFGMISAERRRSALWSLSG